MMSCGICLRWQHIQCHDRADRATGHPRRNWKFEEFICSECSASQRVRYNKYFPASKKQPPLMPTTKPFSSTHTPQVQSYGASQPIESTNTSVQPHNGRTESHYLSHYRDSAQQGYHMKSNGHQYLNTQQYPSDSTTPSTLSFNHYQPAQHSFLTSTQKTPYSNSNVHPPYSYSISNLPSHRHQQHPRGSTSNHNTQVCINLLFAVRKSLMASLQPTTPSWNVDAATHHPTNLHPNRSVAITNPLLYMHSPSDVRDQLAFPSSNNETSQRSYARYSADHYSSMPYKYPISYQHTLGQ